MGCASNSSSTVLIDINRKEIEGKGLVVAADLTEWVGPWGVSFTANLGKEKYMKQEIGIISNIYRLPHEKNTRSRDIIKKL